MQIATVSTPDPDPVHAGAEKAVSSTETLDETSQTFASETPSDAKETVNSTETRDECLTREVCIDQYLWSVSMDAQARHRQDCRAKENDG